MFECLIDVFYFVWILYHIAIHWGKIEVEISQDLIYRIVIGMVSFSY